MVRIFYFWFKFFFNVIHLMAIENEDSNAFLFLDNGFIQLLDIMLAFLSKHVLIKLNLENDRTLKRCKMWLVNSFIVC